MSSTVVGTMTGACTESAKCVVHVFESKSLQLSAYDSAITFATCLNPRRKRKRPPSLLRRRRKRLCRPRGARFKRGKICSGNSGAQRAANAEDSRIHDSAFIDFHRGQGPD